MLDKPKPLQRPSSEEAVKIVVRGAEKEDRSPRALRTDLMLEALGLLGSIGLLLSPGRFWS